MKFKVGDKVVVSPKVNPLLGGLSGIVIETQENPIANTTYYKVDLDEERVFPEHHLIAETEYRFLTELNVATHQLLATCGIKTADSDTKVLRAEEFKKEYNVKWIEEEKKMPTKFTFYTIEGYRMDKSNNTKIPTVTTEVVYKDKDGCATGGSATCDKADYNSRQGVLEALANMCCGGNFDREYNKAVKDNARADKISRTCTYCGQLFDTVAEKEAHEAWHVECRKARHERYLLRKRAKEIAFEEQAQKLAKEIIAEDNKK